MEYITNFISNVWAFEISIQFLPKIFSVHSYVLKYFKGNQICAFAFNLCIIHQNIVLKGEEIKTKTDISSAVQNFGTKNFITFKSK